MARRPISPLKGLASAWFPAALILLLLMALPGAALLALHLLGKEGVVNHWLQDNYRITYNIPVPWWAALILLLVPVLLVLLYFLKLKRKPLQVPSTFLWRKSIEDLHVNALFQWLRNNVLLLLQLLTLLALIYALMAFQVHGATTEGQHYILMIDNSASMSATDVSPSRLAHAKQEAIKEIDGHSDNDFGMILVFNSEAATWQSYTNDRALLRQAIENIPQTQRPTRIKEALDLADGLANPHRSPENEASRPPGEEAGKERTYASAEGIPTEVHLFSDGRFPDVTDFTLGNLNLHFHPIGKTGKENVDNIGLVSLNAGRDEKDPRKIQVLANVRNFTAHDVQVRVQLEVRINGELRDFMDKVAQPIGQAVGAPAEGATGTVIKVDPAANVVTLRMADRQEVIDATTVKVRSTTGTEVGAAGLKKGYQVRVQRKGGQVAEVRVELVPARNVAVEKEKDKDKEKETLKDQPGEGLAAFDLGDVDERANVVLHASLVDVRDSFALDNEAWLVLGQVRRARVLIVGPSNKILHAFFDHPATRKVADITYLSAADLKDEVKYGRRARDGEYDLVVFDRCAPEREEDLPLANTLFIDALPPPWKKDGLPKLKNPHIKGWQSKDPLLRYLAALYDVGIDEAFRFELDPAKNPGVPPRVPRLLESDKDAAVMFALPRQSFRDVVMAFSILNDRDDWNTNWPLQPSFPLFLRNVLYALGNVSDAAGEETVQPGQVKVLRPDAPVAQIEVVDPKGNMETLLRGRRADFSFGKTEQVGVYHVKWEGAGQRAFSVNLLDPDESNIEPRDEFQVGNTRVAAGEGRMQARETWKWIAAAALALLLLEWYVYNRRIFV